MTELQLPSATELIIQEFNPEAKPSQQLMPNSPLFEQSVFIVQAHTKNNQMDKTPILGQLDLLQQSSSDDNQKKAVQQLIDKISSFLDPIIDPGEFVKEAFSASCQSDFLPVLLTEPALPDETAMLLPNDGPFDPGANTVV